MRLPMALLLALLPAAAFGQAAQPQRPAPPGPPAAAHGDFDIVAADRETAWRINRVTGEVVVCRADTTRVEGVGAHCSVAQMQQGQQPQTSQSPGGAGGGRP